MSNLGKIGTLYGVSVGTGDPELITLKALKIIEKTKIIAFPAGIHQKLGVAETIVQPYLQSHHQKLPLIFPYTLDQDILSQAWDSVSESVWAYLEQGEDVAFVCEGDISFFSTFTYLALRIQRFNASLNIVRIPGVASPMAAASALDLPLTIQGEKLAILPALYSVQDLETALDWAQVVVLMKVASVYAQVWEILKQRGVLDRAYVVEKATCKEEKVYAPLSQYSDLQLSYFSILIIKNI